MTTKNNARKEVHKLFKAMTKAGLEVPKGVTIAQLSGMSEVMASLAENPGVATARKASRFVVTQLGVGTAQSLFMALTFLLKHLELDIAGDLEKRLRQARRKNQTRVIEQ